MPKDDLNEHYFNTKTDVAQNLIDDFFSNFDCQRGPLHRKDFK